MALPRDWRAHVSRFSFSATARKLGVVLPHRARPAKAQATPSSDQPEPARAKPCNLFIIHKCHLIDLYRERKSATVGIRSRVRPVLHLTFGCSFLPKAACAEMPRFRSELRRWSGKSEIVRQNARRRVRCALRPQPTSPCSAGNIQTPKICPAIPGVKRLAIPLETELAIFDAG